MTDLNAFDALRELAALHEVAKETRQNMEAVKRAIVVFTQRAEACLLSRPREGLRAVQRAAEDQLHSFEALLMIVHEENEALRRQLGKITVREEDLAARRAERATDQAAERASRAASGGFAGISITGTGAGTASSWRVS